jgi:outer membrane receptor protein involved in Fe transport
MSPLSLKSSFLGLLLAATVVSPAFAQVASPASPTTALPSAAKATKEEEAIQLSPFQVVSANDDGWLAGSTMLGNRTNQPLKDTPITIDALTKEFLMDVGAFTPEQAGAWVANVAVAPDTFRADLGNFNFRGMTNQFSANRNFFRWYGPQDNYNIERLDFGRGSNTLIFGDNDPGGQATTYTKRALPYRQFTKVLAQYGSWGSYRGEFDHNQPLGSTLAFRLNAVERIDYRNFDYNRFRFPGLHGAVTWQPSRNTGIRFEGEASGNYRTWGDNNLLLRERAFTGLGFTSRLTVLPNGRVVDNGTVADSTPDNTPLGDGTLYRRATDRTNPTGGIGQTLTFLNRSTYTPLLSNFTFHGFPEQYNFGGPDNTNDRWYRTYTITFEHRFNEKFAADLAFNQQNQWNEVIQYGSVNTASVDSLGRLFTDVTYNPRSSRNHMAQYRASVVYNFDRWSWMKQFFVLRGEYRDDRNVNSQRQLRTFGPNFGVTTNVQPVYRVFLSDPYPAAAITTERIFATLPPNTRVFTNIASGENYIARAFSGSASGRYFGGRIQTLLGARYDMNYALGKNRTIDGVTRDPVTLEEFEYGDRVDRPDVWTQLPVFIMNKWTKNAGVVYVVNPSLNAYATYSTSYRWGGVSNIIMEPTGPLLGFTKEIGLKGSFLQDRLAWNVAAYDLFRENVNTNITRTGIPSTPGTGPTGLTGVDLSISNALNWGLTPLSPEFKTVRTGASPDVTSQRSRGVESTFTYYPSTGLSVRVSAAFKEVRFVDAFPVLKELLAAAQARGPIADPIVQQTLALLQNAAFVQGAKDRYVSGQFPAVVAPLSGNVAVNYRFDRTSRLAGFNLGLSGTYSGDAVLRYLNAFPDNTCIKGGSSYAVHANAGYRAKLFRRPTTLMLNLSNLWATRYQVISSVGLANGANHNIEIYGQPFQARLTATMEF